jgi:hypothetical protein
VPAVYDPALQQSPVVCPQIPEEGAKSVTSHGLHWGDLGHHGDRRLGPPPGRRSPLAFPVLLFPSGPLPAPRSTWNHVQAQGSAPEPLA